VRRIFVFRFERREGGKEVTAESEGEEMELVRQRVLIPHRLMIE
jgi:hypothetical protein